jgi:N-acetyl-gamma-glutamyl-phosphate reductase
MIRIGIIGSTGSVGEALIRVLLGHPQAKLSFLGSDHASGERVADVLPVLRGQTDVVCRKPDLEALAAEADVVFLAKKGPDSMEWAPKLLDAGLKVIDCGGEFRFRDAAVYEQFYGNAHTCPELLDEAVYGLPELYREELRSARIVGTPGCYPASAILPLAPLLRAGLVEPGAIAVDSYSGLSGAGKRYSEGARNLFVDCDENCRAYAPITHRHAPEIEQELSLAAGREATVLFVPHLIPIQRGILTTLFARLSTPLSLEDVLTCWADAYSGEPFIRLVEEPGDVELAHVAGTNYCDFAAAVDPRTNRLVIVSALDNVIKGAVGSAVQSMNLLCGFDETDGLLHRRI